MLAQSKLYGLPDGVYYCQQERTQQLNERIANRNIPSAFLEPQFPPRPVPTKYTLLPIMDEKNHLQFLFSLFLHIIHILLLILALLRQLGQALLLI